MKTHLLTTVGRKCTSPVAIVIIRYNEVVSTDCTFPGLVFLNSSDRKTPGDFPVARLYRSSATRLDSAGIAIAVYGRYVTPGETLAAPGGGRPTTASPAESDPARASCAINNTGRAPPRRATLFLLLA